MKNHFDVIVAGGGSAGVAAAIGASRAGARTLLLEKGPCLGGAATLRNVVTYCGLYTREEQRQVVFGVADELLTRLRKSAAVSEPHKFNAVAVVFDPESVKFHLDEMCREAGVTVLLHSLVVGASAHDGKVTAVHIADHEGLRWVSADAFIDTSGDADLAQHSGAEVRYGNDGWVQNGSLGVRFGGIPQDIAAGKAEFKAAIREAKAAGIAPLNAETGLVARMPISGDVIAYVVDEGYDARSAEQTSQAEAHARRQAQAYLEALRMIPGCGDAYIVTTGPELGTRESRHVVAPRKLSEDEVLHPSPLADDVVAIGAWPMEYHPSPGIPSEWKFIDDPGYYGIPLSCLTSVNRTNLYAAGRAIDGDRGAGASLRAMGTAFATGQATGVAAALHTRHGIVNVADVRAGLRDQNVWLPATARLDA
ncbi:FAD-dependent oxidoreductase [Paenarthrobacter sp. YAF11_1]|uniref:FAD-dependent oxidoreductase n=1 Tax=Paenarthrobacter sp. YAF11_1 TaxID=3233074 RepID=UPI003F9B098E